jgi:hypothetical protein
MHLWQKDVHVAAPTTGEATEAQVNSQMAALRDVLLMVSTDTLIEHAESFSMHCVWH